MAAASFSVGPAASALVAAETLAPTGTGTAAGLDTGLREADTARCCGLGGAWASVEATVGSRKEPCRGRLAPAA